MFINILIIMSIFFIVRRIIVKLLFKKILESEKNQKK